MDINVTKNKVTISAMDQVNSGEYKITTCNFTFSDTYNGLIKKAIFTHIKDNIAYMVTIDNNTCDIPVEVLKEGVCEIGVYAYSLDNDEFVLRYSPTPARFQIKRGSYVNADEGTTYLPANEFITLSEFNTSQENQNTNINNNANAITTINNNLINYSLITETGNKIDLEIDNATYILTAKLYDKNNNLLSTSTGIDLPLETMVVGASYDSTTKEIILTLKNGNTVKFSIADLISGLVNETTFNATVEVLETDIEELQEENTYLKSLVDQIIPTETLSGTDLTFNNTLVGKLKTNKLIGNCEQDSYSGKNKLNPLAEQGSINFTTGENEINENSIRTPDYINISSMDTIYFSRITDTTNIKCRYYNSNKEYIGGQPAIGTALTSTLTKPENAVYLRLAVDVYNVDYFTQFNCQISNTNTTYEQYVGGIPSPNPDYPQDIRVITGDNSVVVQNKNLFGNIEQGGINESGNYSSSVRVRTIDYISVKSNTQYTISGTQNADNTTILCYVQEYDNTNTLVNYDSNPHDMPYTITTQANTKKIRIVLRTTGNANISPSNVLTKQLELGSTATTYIAHAEQTLPIHLSTNYLAGIGDYVDTIEGTKDDWKIKRNIQKIILDGSEDESWVKATSVQNVFYWAGAVQDHLKASGIIPKSTHFIGVEAQSGAAYMQLQNDNTIALSSSNDGRIYIKSTKFATLSDFTTWLSNNNNSFYYILATTTEETITDTTLISDLNALYEATSYADQTNITTTYEDGNVQMSLNITALKQLS